jgi:hypothetical protein
LINSHIFDGHWVSLEVSFCNYYHGTQFLNTHHVTLGGLLHFWRSLGFVLQLGTFGTTVVPLVPGNKNKYKLHMHQVTQVTCSFCLVTNIHKRCTHIQQFRHNYTNQCITYYNVKHTLRHTFWVLLKTLNMLSEPIYTQ